MDFTLPRTSRPKSRQSLAHLPSASFAADRENATADVSSLQRSAGSTSGADKKKSRGKSLGPGGIEALKESAGNAVKTASALQIKSILKPTVPLTPPKAIPTFDELRKRSTGKNKSPAKNGADELLIDFSTPAPPRNSSDLSIPTFGSANVADPFSPVARKSPRGQTVAVRTELESHDAGHGRDGDAKRKSEKQAILDKRAARRKSMANRRVSFAPEATLHTWSVMELAEESTTSSASNSTRRQSLMTTAQSPAPQDPPSTPPEQTEEPLVKASPARQRDVHQAKRRRRSSGFPAEFDPTNEAFSSSPSGDISVEASPARIEDSIHSDDDDTEGDGDTAMSMETTTNTLASEGSVSSTQSSLDERLRRAASMAGTRGINYDEHGDDLSMELVTGTITNAFQPWVDRQGQQPVTDVSALQDQENFNPFSPAFKAQTLAQQQTEADDTGDQTQDMTMDETRAVGHILSKRSSPGKGRRRSVAPQGRRSSVSRRRSSGEDSGVDDETMDFTAVGGGIIQHTTVDESPAPGNDSVAMSDEDLTMDFTNVVGGVLKNIVGNRRALVQSTDVDTNETMDMTVAIGGILPAIEEQTEPLTDVEDETTSAMDMTMAAGEILPAQVSFSGNTAAKQLMQMETEGETPLDSLQDSGTLPASVHSTPSLSQHVAASVVSETGSPSMTLKPRASSRKSLGPSRPTPPISISASLTPSKQATPSKQVTPLLAHADTPNKTPVMSNVTHRGASPKKLFKAEIKARASPASTQKSALKGRNGLFEIDEKTGHHTPSVVLHASKPHQHLRRRSSGIGIDKEGMGSPRVAELLSKRTSIGEAAPAFAPTAAESRVLRFDDPKAVEEEIDAERAEESRRESGRFIMEREADDETEENATLQLREMIESMTPKKSGPGKLKGRKSLAVGAARGLLGKRPAELDVDDDDDADLTPKRLKMVSREASPVKRIHLPKPPSQDETTGRLTRLQQQSLDLLANPGNATPTASRSPLRKSGLESPQHTGHFKAVPDYSAQARPSSFEDKLDNVVDAVNVSTVQESQNEAKQSESEKLSLQAFLNLTNIHFIELSTTKRRHTMAPNAPARSSEEGSEATLQSCFSAAATTLPLLELYQHATRELKSYISSGRKIIRSIEAETLAEQPPLFHEYLDSRPEVKLVMDNQFRNGKSNARLQSKEGWYAWRGQLVEGLRGGLEGIKQGMQEDLVRVQEHGRVLSNMLPLLSAEHAQLEQETALLEQNAAEFEAVDQEALMANRLQLKVADDQHADKMNLLTQLQRQMGDRDHTLAAADELKLEMRDQIAEADRVREEYRGWASKDVFALKAKLDAIEKQSSWSLITAEDDYEEPNEYGVALTMVYKRDMRLFFYPAAYQTKSSRRRSGRRSRSNSGPTAPVSLTYVPKSNDDGDTALALPTEQRFFLQSIRSQLHAFAMMPRGSVSAKTLLDTVSSGWDLAGKVSNEIRLLNTVGIATAAIVGDENLSTKLMLLLEGRGRVDLEFILSVTMDIDGKTHATTAVRADALYGSVTDLLTTQKIKKVQQALGKEIETRQLGTGTWVNAIQGFEHWLQTQVAPKTQGHTVQQAVQKTPARTPATGAAPGPAPELVPTPAPAAIPVAPAVSAKRSPLTAKKTSIIQKKSIPVPQPRQEKVAALMQQREKEKEKEKENIPPPSQSQAQELGKDKDFVKPAIAPELQEQMMHTPIKRVGALRRSPMAGV